MKVPQARAAGGVAHLRPPPYFAGGSTAHPGRTAFVITMVVDWLGLAIAAASDCSAPAQPRAFSLRKPTGDVKVNSQSNEIPRNTRKCSPT